METLPKVTSNDYQQSVLQYLVIHQNDEINSNYLGPNLEDQQVSIVSQQSKSLFSSLDHWKSMTRRITRKTEKALN